MPQKHSPTIALAAARNARDIHSRECPFWDYEDNGGCVECDDHDRKVAAAKRAVRKAATSEAA